MNLCKKIQFSSFGGYRRFTRYWWNDILRTIYTKRLKKLNQRGNHFGSNYEIQSRTRFIE